MSTLNEVWFYKCLFHLKEICCCPSHHLASPCHRTELDKNKLTDGFLEFEYRILALLNKTAIFFYRLENEKGHVIKQRRNMFDTQI